MERMENTMRNVWNLPEDRVQAADMALAARSIDYLVRRGVSQEEAACVVAQEFQLDGFDESLAVA